MRRLAITSLVLAAVLGTALQACADDDAKPAPAIAAPAQPHDLTSAVAHAQQLRSQGQYEEAIRVLAQLMLVAPDDARVVGEYGKALVQQGRSQDAVAFLTRAVQLNPDDWTLYSALGVAEDQLGQRPAAAQAYRKALALKPGEPSVLNNLALNMMLEGRLAEADTLLKEAAARDGGNPRITENLKRLAGMRAADPAPRSAPQSQRAAPTALAAARPHRPAAAPAPRPSHAPRPLLATAEQHAGGAVVMQKLPFDPLAGKHYGPAKPERQAPAAKLAEKPVKPMEHLASAAPQPKPDPVPALRTAADIY